MRILIVSTYFPPQNSVGSLRPYSWAKYGARFGHDVTVLTTTKSESSEHALERDSSAFQVMEVEPPSLYRLASRLYRTGGREASGVEGVIAPSLAKRLAKKALSPLMELRARSGICNACRMPDLIDGWQRRALRAVRNAAPWDLVISTAGPYVTHLVADRVKREGLARGWIADYRDLWADSELFPGLPPFSWFERRLERTLMERADRITTVSQPLADVLSQKYGKGKVRVVENGFDPDDFMTLSPKNFFPPDGKFRLVYTGMIYGGKRDPSPLFEAMARLKKSGLLRNLEVLFAGCLMANLQELIDKYQVGPWVRPVGFLHRKDALRMQRDAGGLLFLEWNKGGALTGKLFEYLFSGTPIWAIGVDRNHVAGALIEEAEAGLVLGTDVDAIEVQLRRWLTGGELPSHANREVVQRYTREALTDRILKIGEEALCAASQRS